MPPLAELERRAIEALRERGYEVDRLEPPGTGKPTRFRTESDSQGEKSGWCFLNADEWANLVIGGWRTDEPETVPLYDNAGAPLSAEERRERDEAWRRQREKLQEARRREFDSAAAKAKNDLAHARDVSSDFPYIARKGVTATPGLRLKRCKHPERPKEPAEDALLVPLVNAQGEVRSYQRIYADGTKRHFYGAEKNGMFYEMPGQGANAGFLLMAEGWATAVTIAMASKGETVISVCDRGNFWHVLDSLSRAGRLDPARTMLVADNDWATAARLFEEAKAKGRAAGKTVDDFNPGLQAAKAAAQAFGCRWTLAVQDGCTYPDSSPASDANDLFMAKKEECLRGGMTEDDAVRMGLDTVEGMIDRGWGVEDAPPAQEPQKPPMQFIPFGEAVDLTPPAELVKGFLPATGIGYLFGPSGTFKTFIGMQLGLHVSQGWPLAGNKVKRKPVYYLLLEGSTGLGKRTRALNNWRVSMGRELAPDTAYMFWPRPFIITDPASVDALIATVNGAGHQGALIVIDTQSQAAPGVDEDKAKDMTLVLGEAKRISESTRGVVLLVGHTGKDEERGLRGSYAQRANVDFTLEVKRQPGARRVALKTGKEKDNSDDQAIAFDVQIWDVGTDEDGDPVSSCVAVPLEGVEYKPAPKATPAQERALDTLLEAMRLKGADRVSRDEWGEVYLSKHPGTTAESKRVSFSKDRKALVEAKLVDCENDYYWPVSEYA